MIISSVKLNNFRCHGDFSYDFKKKTSVIIGENGSGKTSILEAVYEALRGKSFRAVDSDILKRESDFYRIEVNFTDGEKTVVAFGDLDASHELKKQFLVGGKKYARLPKKYRYPIVLFLPDDLHLLSSSPTKKRDFFDRILSELNDNYITTLNRYEKALKQRNDLLKSFADGSIEELRSFIFSWNLLLAKYGTEIRKERQKFISELNERLTNVYRTIAGGNNNDEIIVEYKLQGEDVSEGEYFKRLEAELNRDLILGHTGFGVHRDSYEFIFNNTNADGSASRGEVRSIFLAMKFIEADLIFEKYNKRPIVLLDDVFSELDEGRQKCLTRNFKDNQVIITSTEMVE
jgi:DNA replication and repair protein RecF